MNPSLAPTRPGLAPAVAFWRSCGVGVNVRLLELRHFAFACKYLLRVRDREHGRLVAFELNEEQRALAGEIIRQFATGEPVRIIVLKARQLGITTVLVALECWLSMLLGNVVTLVMAHVGPTTDNVVSMARRFACELPPWARGHFGAERVDGGVAWANGSRIHGMTQGGNDRAASFSPTIYHATELAKWDKQRSATTAEEPLVAALGSLGTGRGTIAVIESTANGASGSMHARWYDAVDGRSGWTPIFFSWVRSTLYQLPDRPEDAAVTAEAHALIDAGDRAGARAVLERAGIEAPWPERAVAHRMTVAQCRWALAKTVEMGSLEAFDQEYPVSPELAFAASGRRVWSDAEVTAIPTPAPIWTSGPLRRPMRGEGLATGWALLEQLRTPGDVIRVWARPEPSWTARYVAGVDCGYGVGGETDGTACSVVDRVTRLQVAEYLDNAHGTPADAAYQVSVLGAAYGHATVCHEANGIGVTFGQALFGTLAYPNGYVRRLPTATPDLVNPTSIYGFVSGAAGSAARDGVCMRLRLALRDRTLIPQSSRFTAQMRTWVYDETGRADHTPGAHDDALFGAVYALYAEDQSGPVVETVKTLRDPNRWYDDDEYRERTAWET